MKLLLLLLGLVVNLDGATSYVSPTGSDSNPGTLTLPFLTIQKGVNSASPGDTIIVENGTYTPPPSAGCSAGTGYMVAITKSGTASAPITLKAQHKWGAVLDAQSTCHTVIYLYGYQYWNIQDFEVMHGYWWGIATNSGASNFTIKGNKIHDIGRRTDTSGIGMAGIYADPGSDNIAIDGNMFYNSGRTGGNYVGSNDHGCYLHSTNSTVINNIFYEPIEGYEIETASGFSGNIANNTFIGPNPYGNGGLIVLWDVNGAVTVQNNIFYNPAITAIHQYQWSSTACAITNNIVYGPNSLSDGSLAACTQSANLMNANPLFVNLGNNDYHLQSTSPAIDKGVTLSYVPTAFDGIGRPQGPAYDIGAYEVAPASINDANGIVNGASFSGDSVSPGMAAALFGANLADTAFMAASGPALSTTLGDAQVLVNGIPAPLFYVSPGQINFQVPWEVSGSSAQVVVVSKGIQGSAATVKLAPETPGIFTAVFGGQGQASATNEDLTANSASNPARVGSIVQLFATGLGSVSPQIPDGKAAPDSPLSTTMKMPIVLIGGIPAAVSFSGLAPELVGVYQINAEIPAVIQPNNAVPLQIQIGGGASNMVTIAVR